MSSAFAVGFGHGALVAAQLGPISLLLIRTVMRGAIASGLAIGCAVANALLPGVGLGSLAWHVVLTGIVGVARTRVSDRGLQFVDLVAGSGLTAFGGLLGLRALQEE